MLKTITDSNALFEMYRRPRERRSFRQRCNDFLKRRGLDKTESMPRISNKSYKALNNSTTMPIDDY